MSENNQQPTPSTGTPSADAPMPTPTSTDLSYTFGRRDTDQAVGQAQIVQDELRAEMRLYPNLSDPSNNGPSQTGSNPTAADPSLSGALSGL